MNHVSFAKRIRAESIKVLAVVCRFVGNPKCPLGMIRYLPRGHMRTALYCYLPI